MYLVSAGYLDIIVDFKMLSSLSRSQRHELPHALQDCNAPTIANDIQLLNPRECIPDQFRTVFPYDLFNKVQSRCFASVYKTSDNVVVSAPTGSGKTALLELAICKLASQYVADSPRN